MAKKKIDIKITFKDDVPVPAAFIRKHKVKRKIPFPDDGDWGILTIFEELGQRDMFFIKLGPIDEVEIK